MTNITEFAFIVFTAVCMLVPQASCGGSLGSPAAVTMDVTPQYSSDVIPNAVNFRCGLSSGGNCGMTIVSIQLSKDDQKLLARLVGEDTITYGRLLQSSLEAEGRIERDASESYLSMTINDAVSEDSGLYTCKVVYWDESDQIKEVSITRNITFTDQDTQDIVRHLMAKVSFMGNMMQFREDQYRRNFSSLEAKLQTMQDKIDQSEQKRAALVTFTATHNQTGSFATGRVLVYANTIVNVGGGYDNASGVFTAPLAGYYFFSVSVYTRPRQYMFLDLRNGKGEILTTLLSADNDGWHDQGTGTCVVLLAAGDQVKPFIGDLNGSTPVDGRYPGHRLNMFYGYLLRAV